MGVVCGTAQQGDVVLAQKKKLKYKKENRVAGKLDMGQAREDLQIVFDSLAVDGKIRKKNYMKVIYKYGVTGDKKLKKAADELDDSDESRQITFEEFFDLISRANKSITESEEIVANGNSHTTATRERQPIPPSTIKLLNGVTSLDQIFEFYVISSLNAFLISNTNFILTVGPLAVLNPEESEKFYEQYSSFKSEKSSTQNFLVDLERLVESWFRRFFKSFFKDDQIEEILIEKIQKFKKCFEKFERESSIESCIYNLKDELGLDQSELNAVADIDMNLYIKKNHLNNGAKLSILDIDNIPKELYQEVKIDEPEPENEESEEEDSEEDCDVMVELNTVIPKKSNYVAPLFIEQPRPAGKGLKYAKMGKTPTLSAKERASKLLQLQCHSLPKKSMMANDMNTQAGMERMTIRATMSVDHLREQLIGKMFQKIDYDNDHVYQRTQDSMIAEAKREGIELSSTQENTLYSQVDREYKDIIELVNKFKTNNDFPSLRDTFIELSNKDPEVLPGCSATKPEDDDARNKRFQAFKNVLKKFQDPEIGLISPKQYALFMELYAHEDIGLLSAWEVFNTSNDSEDFIDTLFIIEKMEYFYQRIDVNEDGMGQGAETDLTILYNFKQGIPNLTYCALTKLVRKGDFYISGIFSNYKSGMIDKMTTVRYLIEYGEENRTLMNEKDKKKKEMKLREKLDWRIEGKDLIEDYCWRFQVESTRQEKCLYSAINNNDSIVEAIMRVLWLNIDKGEFYENLKIYTQVKLRSSDPMIARLEEIMIKGKLKIHIIGRAIDILEDKANLHHATIQDMAELLDVTDDPEEFCSSVNAYLKKAK